MMPQMNGFGVLAKLRSTPKTRTIPVIIVSACAPSDRQLLMLPGVTEVVTKGTLGIGDFRALLVNTLRLELTPSVQ
jgi:CheY-like chemotaxis protein